MESRISSQSTPGSMRIGRTSRARRRAAAILLCLLPAVTGAGAAYSAQSACLPEDIQNLSGLETYDDFYQRYGSSADLCVKVWTGWTAYDLPAASYLAKELLATNTLTLGIVQPDRTYEGATFGAEIEYNLGFKPYKTGGIGNSIRFGLEYSDASEDQYFGQVDPGAGYGLGIPGPLGGPSGAFLGTNPANIVEDATYSGDLSWAAPYFNLERRYEGRDHAIGVFVGTKYSYLDLDEHFSGVIPGYTSDFRYDSQLRTDAWGLHVGARGRFDICDPWGNWQPQVAIRGHVGLAQISAEATDTLTYGGFLSTLVANSSNTLSADYTRLYYSLGMSLALNNVKSSTQFFADFQLDGRPWFPTLERDGTNPTRLEPGTATVFSLTGGMRIRF